MRPATALCRLLLAVCCLLFAVPQLALAIQPRIIYLQPLTPAPPQPVLDAARSGLLALYPVEVRILPPVPLPKVAWYPPRHRWRADKLLDWMAPRMPKDGAKILGLTAADISTTKDNIPDWGVLGLGSMDGAACVISSFRAKRGVTTVVMQQRMAKVAVHEVGHTFGLPHCPTVGCLMEDAMGKVATTDREDDICPVCRAKLAKTGVVVPAKPALPWPTVR